MALILRAHADEYRRSYHLSPQQRRLLGDVERCRTAALGGHLYVCQDCGFEQPHYDSCRNRGCPNCQALAQARWIEEREQRILPIGHHHVVFTLPGQLRPLTRRHPKIIFNVFFEAVRDTLKILSRDVLKGRLGVTAVLHTWTRELLYHPHIHCIVTAGALSLDDTSWLERTRFLFPSARMKALFRARLLRALGRARNAGALHLAEDDHGDGHEAWRKLIRSLPPKRKWVVYIQQPFGRSTHVIRYLGRYTHRIGISAHRLISATRHAIRFRTREGKTCSVAPLEFVRRFMLHVLPKGFHKIRHFGLYGTSNVNTRLPIAQKLLDCGDRDDTEDDEEPTTPETWDELLARLTQADPLRCHKCNGRLRYDRSLPSQRPKRPP